MLDTFHSLSKFGAGLDDFEFWKTSGEGLKIFSGSWHIHFVGDDARWFGDQRGIVEPQFLAEALVIIDRMTPFTARHVDDIEKCLTANDMSQKFMAKAAIFMRAFDQAGNVCHRGAAEIRQINHTDKRMQCREWIGGRFRLGGRNGAQKRGFAGVGVSHEPDIGNRSKLHEKPPFLAGIAFGVLAGHPVG